MAYIALYRKWRPQDFNNLIGQEHIRKTLANAIEQGKVAHAYLFSGSRGTGKTSTAKILAKALNCEHGPTATPCNKCSCCEKINNGSFMDVFEIDAASNRGIDEIRELRETVKFAPVEGRYKVYIIDEVHMLTTEAFNALLKTLEEPPEHVVFILATTEVHKVPITIQSRCQRYDFRRITKEDILSRLKEVMASINIEADASALELIAIQSDGGMRDALSLLDQCLAFTNQKLTVEEVHKVLGLVGNTWIWQLTDFIIEKKENSLLEALNQLIADGKDLKQILSEFILHLRSLMIYKATQKMNNMEVYLEDEDVLKRQSGLLQHGQIVELIQLANDTLNALKWAPHGRIAVETMFLKMCWNTPETTAAPAAPVQKAAASSGDEQTSFLLNKIQNMEQLIQNLSREIDNLNRQEVLPKTETSAAQASTVSQVSSHNPAAVAATISAPSETAAQLNENLLNTLAKITPAAVTAPLPSISVAKKTSHVKNSNTSVDINVPETMQMEYNGNIHQLWKRIKQVINQTKGLVGLARVMKDDVTPYQISNNQLFLNMTKPFVYHRMLQNLKQLEQCVYQICKLDLRIVLMVNGQIVDRLHNASSLTTLPELPQAAPAPQPAAVNPVEHYGEEDIPDFMEDIPLPDDNYFENAEETNIALPVTETVDIDKDANALEKAMDIFNSENYDIIEENDK